MYFIAYSSNNKTKKRCRKHFVNFDFIAIIDIISNV